MKNYTSEQLARASKIVNDFLTDPKTAKQLEELLDNRLFDMLKEYVKETRNVEDFPIIMDNYKDRRKDMKINIGFFKKTIMLFDPQIELAKRFMLEKLKTGNGRNELASDVYQEYVFFCGDNASQPLGRTTYYDLMRREGYILFTREGNYLRVQNTLLREGDDRCSIPLVTKR